ncbi:MAG: PilZ domain-containing protein [Planctomycetes bacterium]|nr:PilZ domain-containing protein [Planctomycetota bacterium]
MAEPTDTTTTDQRRALRTPFDASVAIDLDAARIEGSGENLSAVGVFFTAVGPIPVTVHLAGRAGGIRGELVRCESMGDGRLGLAVRFLEPLAAAAS